MSCYFYFDAEIGYGLDDDPPVVRKSRWFVIISKEYANLNFFEMKLMSGISSIIEFV